MQFSSGCTWITSETEPISIETWRWQDLQAGGITDFGAALLELGSKLSRKEFLKSQTGAYAPVILLFSDGGPTDNWEKALKIIKENNWFKNAIKIALDIEGSSDCNVLEAFTGNSEAILDAKDQNTLKKMIHKVSVRASEFQSHSKQSEDTLSSPEEDSADIVNAVVNEVEQEESGNDNGEWGEWQ